MFSECHLLDNALWYIDKAYQGEYMPLETILTFFLITFVATVTPGPTVLYVASCGLSHGTRGYIAGSLGVLVADLMYFILTVTGINTILLTSYEIFSLIKWLGTAYLIYLGMGLILSAFSHSLETKVLPARGKTFRRIFVDGFILHSANPKTVLFFSALLPQFISSEQAMFFQASVLGAILLFTALCVFFIYGVVATHFRILASQSNLSKFLNLTSGSLLVSAGMWLAAVRRE